jgi:HEPN domain-containing protein
MWETLCYQAQQAAEKAIKAVLIRAGTEPPRTHNIEHLLQLLPATLVPPDEVAQAASLTDYAMETRCPGREPPVTEEEYREALRLAEVVFTWAAGLIGAA